MAEIKLLSELGTNYTELHNFLARRDWLNADAATSTLILKIAGKNYYEYLSCQDIKILSCTDIDTIDKLWMYYSNGHFGFTPQLELWKKLISKFKIADSWTYSNLTRELKWSGNDRLILENKTTGKDFDFSNFPKGYLPMWGLDFKYYSNRQVLFKPGKYGVTALDRWVKKYPSSDYSKDISTAILSIVTLPLRGFFLKEFLDCEITILHQFFLRLEKCLAENCTSLEADINLFITKDINTIASVEPKNHEEVRKITLQSIATRRGQTKFRQYLLNAYNYRCVITGCNAEEALEAAHIIAYCETENNAINNGLLLRADIHTLFDLNLIAIAPGDNYPNDRESLTVQVAPNLRHTSYGELHNKSIKNLPKNQSDLPDRDFLILRCQQCDWFIEQKQLM